jgi:uncharacterized CHY-type Zn-finger protein
MMSPDPKGRRPEDPGPAFLQPSSRNQPDAPEVKGIGLDPNTRCLHYHSDLDVIAIRMRCCGEYYACIDCHAAMAGHAPEVWPRSEWKNAAVLCGVCLFEMSVLEYMASANRCPRCAAPFNPGCRNHYHLYFETDHGLDSR